MYKNKKTPFHMENICLTYNSFTSGLSLLRQADILTPALNRFKGHFCLNWVNPEGAFKRETCLQQKGLFSKHLGLKLK